MDHLDAFMNELFFYLTECRTNQNELTIFRKHNNKLETNGDISLPLNKSAWKKYLDTTIVLDQNTNLKNELINRSKTWPISINNIKIENEKLNIFLNRSNCFEKTITFLHKNPKDFVSSKIFDVSNIQIQLETIETSKTDLSSLRLRLLKDVINNLLEISGNNNKKEPEIIYLTYKSKSDIQEKKIVCGVVIGNKFGKKNSEITADEYYSKRIVDMRLMAQHKYGVRVNSEPHWSDFFEKLGNSAVIYDLLHVKPSRTIVINIENASSTHSKGASFILYNCARLSTIFKNFEKKVDSGVYPPLPDLNQIDFTLLNQHEEWELLYVYLMQYPGLIKSCIKDICNCKLNVHNLCTFLDSLCSLFSCYYRRIRILMEPREHLFPVLHARIYLLKAVLEVLHNALGLLNMSPVTQM